MDHEQIQALARAKKEAELEHYGSFMAAIDKAKNLGSFIRMIAAVSICGAVWTTTIQLTINSLQKQHMERALHVDKMFSERNVKLEKFDAYIESNKLAVQALTTSMGTMQDRITEHSTELKEMRPKVDRMWWMKEMGLTNKDKPLPSASAGPPP